MDNVDQGKLLKQMWTMGIQNKRLLCIILAMLKAEIEGIGIPSRGTCQGGIISPLLSNIVLNELDWWISDQWENFETSHLFARNDNKLNAIRKDSKLKECYIIRYADDFKIMCRTRDVAEKIFIAVKVWLKARLHLEISPDKSKITNLRKKTSEFLGFSIKAVVKGTKQIAHSKIQSDAIIYLVKHPVENRSIEYNDNRISLFSAQRGKCRILGTRLNINDFHCHHIKPIQGNGNDKYKNLVILHPDIDQLIHATKSDTIHQLLEELNLSNEQIEKVNKIRLATLYQRN